MVQLSTYSGLMLGLKSSTLWPLCTGSGNNGFGKFGSMDVGARVGKGPPNETLPKGPKLAGKFTGSTLVERLRPWLPFGPPARKPIPSRMVAMENPARITESPLPVSQERGPAAFGIL